MTTLPLSVFLPMSGEVPGSLVSTEEKYTALRTCLLDMGSVVIGYSGGADSALLAKVAYDELGDQALAVIAASESYPKRERDGAIALAAHMGFPVQVVDTNELIDENYASNPTNRCYYCKRELFVHLEQAAKERGFRWIAYGANHDDLGDHRPGQTAAIERGVRAPLIEAGLTKAEVRHLSRQLGLPTWDKPAMACLSSRFPYGTRITAELLERLDQAEDYLRHDLKFHQVRVRHHGTIARVEVGADEMNRLLEEDLRNRISNRLKELGYSYVAVELGGYKSGSLNAGLSPSQSHGH
jgi:pyridinium-3,5-biscarboxylic acid mononucleotide sulfurtransferase